MATSTTTPTDPITAALTSLKTTIGVGVTLPGESILVALISFASTERTTMNQTNRDKFDAVFVQQLQDFQSINRKFWEWTGLLTVSPQS